MVPTVVSTSKMFGITAIVVASMPAAAYAGYAGENNDAYGMTIDGPCWGSLWDHSIWGTDGIGKGLQVGLIPGQTSTQGVFNVGDFWNNQIDYISVGGSVHCLLELWFDHFAGNRFAQEGPIPEKDVDVAQFSDEEASSWRLTFKQPPCSPDKVRPFPGFVKERLQVTDLECTLCPDGFYKPAGSKWTKQCLKHTDCTAHQQYTKVRGTTTSDAICAPLTVCADDQIDTTPSSEGGTGDRDRVCTDMVKYATFGGTWSLASTNGRVSHTATFSFSSTETTTGVNAESFQRGLSDALSVGAKINFGLGYESGGVSASTGIELSTQYTTTESRSWTDSVSKTLSTQTTTQQSIGHTCEQACTEPGVEAYIFKVVGKLPDGRIDEVETCNFACVPLASKDPTPKCPPGKCGNAACSCCDDDSWVDSKLLASGYVVPVCSVNGNGDIADVAAGVAHSVTVEVSGRKNQSSQSGKLSNTAANTLSPLAQLQTVKAELQILRLKLEERNMELAKCIMSGSAEPKHPEGTDVTATADTSLARGSLRIRGRHV